CFLDIELLTAWMSLVLDAGPWGVVSGWRLGNFGRRFDVQFGQGPPHNFPHGISNCFIGHYSLFSSSSFSMESTTPMMAQSIAAPASPVEAVEADQPS